MESNSEHEEKPLLITSGLLGPPPYVPDPQDLSNSFKPFPDKIGSQFRQVDEETLAKYGPGVSLAEAEAMDFVFSHTSIKCPKVIGAYVLDGKGHIMMSYEQGKLLPEFWGRASDKDKETVIEHYLGEMRNIPV
ncbi:hypothetical protein F5B21DRAFT_464105 [Xylaria acuta]|nr:hypothetical protein F5B21DRAFT_464105 [Xylaria acuta]